MAAPVVPQSNWTVPGLIAKLPGFRRVDVGGELLACRLAGESPGRTVYVHLATDEPAAIFFDFEDSDSDIKELGHTPESGSVDSVGDLALVLRWWLDDPIGHRPMPRTRSRKPAHV